MLEAAQGDSGHDGVAGENVDPITEAFVSGDNRGHLFVVMRQDYLKQEQGLIVVETEVAVFVNDARLGRGQHLRVVRRASEAEAFPGPDVLSGLRPRLT